MQDEKNIVVFRDVIYLDGDLWRIVRDELLDKDKLTDSVNLTRYPIFERRNNGAIVPYNYLSKHVSKILFFDVTEASDIEKRELCEKYGTTIHELPIPTKSVSQYLTLLPVLSDEFKSLNKSERDTLGNDFAYVEYRDGGLRVTKCIMSPRGAGIPNNVYLNIDFSKLPLELEDKIMPAVSHMVLNEKGYYDKLETTSETKEYGK